MTSPCSSWAISLIWVTTLLGGSVGAPVAEKEDGRQGLWQLLAHCHPETTVTGEIWPHTLSFPNCSIPRDTGRLGDSAKRHPSPLPWHPRIPGQSRQPMASHCRPHRRTGACDLVPVHTGGGVSTGCGDCRGDGRFGPVTDVCVPFNQDFPFFLYICFL